MANISNIINLIKKKGLTPFNEEISLDQPLGLEKNFTKYYKEHIHQCVEKFEKERIETLLKFRKRLIVILPIWVVSIVFVIMINSLLFSAQSLKITMVLVFPVLLFLTIWAYKPIKNYKTAIKQLIFPKIFRFFGDDYIYSKIGIIPIMTLKKSGIIPDYSEERTEDYIKGSYNGVSFQITEAFLYQYKPKGIPYPVFKGIFIILKMNNKFSGKTVLKRDLGKIKNWIADKTNKLENVKLEDPVFEEKFEAYSTDQVEARYLLTTSFMERLLKLSKLFNHSKIQCSFYDDKLLLMIPSNQDMFETSSIFEPATFVEDINTILEQMSLLFQIIDILKLNLKIGL